MTKYKFTVTNEKAFNAFIEGVEKQREERKKLYENSFPQTIAELPSSGLNSAMDLKTLEEYHKNYGLGETK